MQKKHCRKKMLFLPCSGSPLTINHTLAFLKIVVKWLCLLGLEQLVVMIKQSIWA